MPRVKKTRKRVKLAFKRKTKSYKRRKSIRKKKSKRRLTYRRKQSAGSGYGYGSHKHEEIVALPSVPYTDHSLNKVQIINFSQTTNAEEGILKTALKTAKPINVKFLSDPMYEGNSAPDNVYILKKLKNLEKIKIEIFDNNNPVKELTLITIETNGNKIIEKKSTDLVFEDYLHSNIFRSVEPCSWTQTQTESGYTPPCAKSVAGTGNLYISENKETLKDFKLIEIVDQEGLTPQQFIIEANRIKLNEPGKGRTLGTLKFYFSEEQLIKLEAKIHRNPQNNNLEIVIPYPNEY